MSNKPAIDFIAFYIGDGTSTSVTFALLDDPVLVRTGGTTEPLLASTLSVLSISDAVNVQAGGGPAVSSSSYSALLKTLTVNFASAPASGMEYYIVGTFVF